MPISPSQTPAPPASRASLSSLPTLVNTRILADNLAQRGRFRVYVPDFLNGTKSPVYVMDAITRLSESGIWASVQKP